MKIKNSGIWLQFKIFVCRLIFRPAVLTEVGERDSLTVQGILQIVTPGMRCQNLVDKGQGCCQASYSACSPTQQGRIWPMMPTLLWYRDPAFNWSLYSEVGNDQKTLSPCKTLRKKEKTLSNHFTFLTSVLPVIGDSLSSEYLLCVSVAAGIRATCFSSNCRRKTARWWYWEGQQGEKKAL